MSVESQLAAARQIRDPVARAVRLHEIVLPAVECLRDEVVEARWAAIAEAADAAEKLEDLAGPLGLTKMRISQIRSRYREGVPRPRGKAK